MENIAPIWTIKNKEDNTIASVHLRPLDVNASQMTGNPTFKQVDQDNNEENIKLQHHWSIGRADVWWISLTNE